ncbi:hypothetical protein SAMN05444392_11939 [Seinonella peptonophila]|uniref:Uncharacterized protein n=1 Tax=Seinonella peptonophila TaxID=112248 RepID=A0A1M5B8A3_9BACL|nr:hypothetical protein [Seinonella peptonophila]SHF38781.1 hypothetical protein SAMN05444392_11939 [Seinonella peptonophila]
MNPKQQEPFSYLPDHIRTSMGGNLIAGAAKQVQLLCHWPLPAKWIPFIVIDSMLSISHTPYMDKYPTQKNHLTTYQLSVSRWLL